MKLLFKNKRVCGGWLDAVEFLVSLYRVAKELSKYFILMCLDNSQ